MGTDRVRQQGTTVTNLSQNGSTELPTAIDHEEKQRWLAVECSQPGGVLNRIRDGVLHFREQVFPTHRVLFEGLEDGQYPAVMFITCADSRVDPSLITSSPPGTLFVLRNAGNLIPAFHPSSGGEAATVDYAVRALGVRHVVVCSHSGCGALTHLVSGRAGDTPMDRWLVHAHPIRDAVHRHYPEAEGDELIEAAAFLNALGQLDNLRTHPAVARAEEAGELKLHAWMYEIGTGTILAYDEAKAGFLPLEEAQMEDPLLADLSTWSATLRAVGIDRDAVAKAIARITSWPRPSINRLLNRLPIQLLTGLSHIEAEVVETWLTEAGATVEILRED